MIFVQENCQEVKTLKKLLMDTQKLYLVYAVAQLASYFYIAESGSYLGYANIIYALAFFGVAFFCVFPYNRINRPLIVPRMFNPQVSFVLTCNLLLVIFNFIAVTLVSFVLFFNYKEDPNFDQYISSLKFVVLAVMFGQIPLYYLISRSKEVRDAMKVLSSPDYQDGLKKAR